MLDRTLAPSVYELEPFKISRAVEVKLSNKIPFNYINSGTQPVIRIEFIFSNGTYSDYEAGTSYFALKMLNEGTKLYSSKELAEKLAEYGAFLELEPGNDRNIISVTMLNKNINFILPIVKELLFNSTFPATNFESIKKIYQQNLQISFEKTSFVAGGLFRKAIFGASHPYGHFLEVNDVNAITLDNCQKFYHQFIKESNFEMIVSGLVSEQIIEKIEDQFGDRKYKNLAAQTIRDDVKPKIAEKIYLEKEGSVQSSIRIGKKIFTRKHPDYLKFSVLNETLGGYFGSRLMKNIREEKGLTYGIYSQLSTLKHEGYFMIATDVKKEIVRMALTEIYKEVKNLTEVLISDQELATVKNYMIGSFLSSINTPFSLANKYKTVHFNELNYDFYDSYVQNIKKITPKDLKQIAEKYFDRSTFTEVVVG